MTAFTRTQAAKAIVWTQPHGAQIIRQLDPNEKPLEVSPKHDRNALYQVLDDQGRELILTGWELDSLALQWLLFKEGVPTPHLSDQ
jgi:streptogramin lyase